MYNKVVPGKINFLFRIRSQLTAAMKSLQIVSIIQQIKIQTTNQTSLTSLSVIANVSVCHR